MLLSAVSVLVVAHSSSEILEGLMNKPVYILCNTVLFVATEITLTFKWENEDDVAHSFFRRLSSVLDMDFNLLQQY